jgi:hypothetical protein
MSGVKPASPLLMDVLMSIAVMIAFNFISRFLAMPKHKQAWLWSFGLSKTLFSGNNATAAALLPPEEKIFPGDIRYVSLSKNSFYFTTTQTTQTTCAPPHAGRLDAAAWLNTCCVERVVSVVSVVVNIIIVCCRFSFFVSGNEFPAWVPMPLRGSGITLTFNH